MQRATDAYVEAPVLALGAESNSVDLTVSPFSCMLHSGKLK